MNNGSYFRNIDFSGVSTNKLDRQPGFSNPGNFSNFSLNIPQKLNPFIPETMNMVFNYIVNKVSSNDFRAIHFNMAVGNNGGNPELSIISTLLINFAVIQSQGNLNNVGNAITNYLQKIVDDRLNFIVISNNELLAKAQASGNNVAESIHSSATDYIRVVNEVENFLSQAYTNQTVNLGGSPSNNNGNNGFNQQNSMFNGFNQNNNGNMLGQSNMNRVQQQGGFGNVIQSSVNGQPINNGNDRFSAPAANAFINIAPKEIKKHVDEFEQKTRPDFTKVNQGEQPKLVDKNAPASQQLYESNLEWKPSDKQSFKFAYRKHQYDSRIAFSPENPGITLFSLSLRKDNMDRSAHALPVAEKFLASRNPDVDREKQITSMLTSAVSAQTSVNEGTKETYVSQLNDVRNNTRVVFSGNINSVEEAIALTREAQLAFTDNPEGIYFSEFNLVDSFPVLESDYDEFSSLRNYRTHEELSNYLKFAISNVRFSPTLRRAFVQVNFKLARDFIDFLRFYMSITEFSNSDSYMEDACAIIDDIKSTYGKSFSDRVLKMQEHFFDLYMNFSRPTSDDKSEVAEQVISDNDEEAVANGYKRVVMVEFKVPSMMLCTEFTSNEYNLSVGSDVGSYFNNKCLPDVFVELAHSMIKANESKGLGDFVKRFFLVTLDGVKYELNASVVGDKAPMIIIKR